MKAATRNALPLSDFADPAHRRFPMQNKAHIAAAESYIRYASPEVAAKIRAKAKSMGPNAKRAHAYARIAKAHQKD